VRQEQLVRARKQRDEAEARAEGGVGPKIEVVRASAGVSRRIESNIRAWLLVKDRQRAMKRIVNVAGADVDSETMLVLTSEPVAVRYEIDQAELIELSMAERIELLELELELAKAMSTIDFAQNQALPLFVLDYTYRFHGTGNSFGESWEHGGTQSGWGWRLGVDVEIPIGNEAAESRVQRAILERLQRLSSRAAREQSVKAEVLAALDNLESAWQRILAARLNVEAERLNYEAEQGQYQLGLRNSTEVLDAENRLAEARIAEIGARIDYQVAQIDLAFATGTLLGAARVSW
jgi:outer membrane protein TolC